MGAGYRAVRDTANRTVTGEVTSSSRDSGPPRWTEKWYFVRIMGRHAGHLDLGIGSGAGATLTVIGEEFPPGPVSLDQIADTGDRARALATGSIC